MHPTTTYVARSNTHPMGESYFKQAAETCWLTSLSRSDVIPNVVLVSFIFFPQHFVIIIVIISMFYNFLPCTKCRARVSVIQCLALLKIMDNRRLRCKFPIQSLLLSILKLFLSKFWIVSRFNLYAIACIITELVKKIHIWLDRWMIETCIALNLTLLSIFLKGYYIYL